MHLVAGGMEAAVLLAALAVAPDDGVPGPRSRDPEPLEAVVRRAMAETMEAQAIPGAVLALVVGGELRMLEGFGVEDVESGRPVDPAGTLFHVASISKPVTASAALALADRGLLDLDADVRTLVPGLTLESPFAEPVTPRLLLVHASGLDASHFGRKARRPEALEPLAEHLSRKLPPIVRRPGSVSVYSNYGYALLGLAVEEIGGAPFAEVARRELFTPLGMASSSFAIEPRLERRLATGYGWRGAEGPPEGPDAIHTAPASMLRTTAADMARWMRMLLADGAPDGVEILRPETAALQLSRQLGNHPALPGRSLGLAEGGRLEPPGFLHSGGSTGFSAAVYLHRPSGLGIFVAFNSRAFAWDLIREILDGFDADSGRPAAPPVEGGGELHRYAGWYRSAELPLTSMARIATLVEQVRIEAGEHGLRWAGRLYRPAGDGAFRSESGATIAFAEEDGRLRYLFRAGGEYERVSWLASRPVQIVLWGGTLAVLAGVCLAALVRLLRRRPSLRPLARVRRPLAAAAGLDLLFSVLLVAVLLRELSGEGSLAYGVTWWLRGLMTLPILALPLVLWAGVEWVRLVAHGEGSRVPVWTSGAGLAVAALFPLLLASWNLLGYRF